MKLAMTRLRGTLAVICFAGCMGIAHGQGIIFPANADLRAMQTPGDYEGSRAEAYQESEHIFTGAPQRPFANIVAPAGRLVSPPPGTVYVAPATMPKSGPHYSVDILDANSQVVETIAQTSSLMVARAAFKEALKERPHMKIALRQGDKVVKLAD